MRFALLDAQSAGVGKKNARAGPTVLGTGLSVVALKRGVDAGGSTLVARQGNSCGLVRLVNYQVGHGP